jgi:hypothetical protein
VSPNKEDKLNSIEIKQLRQLQNELKQIITLTELHGVNARAKIKLSLEALMHKLNSLLETD